MRLFGFADNNKWQKCGVLGEEKQEYEKASLEGSLE